MTAKDIFRQTRPFCIAKLAIGGAVVLVLLVLLALLMGIGWIFGKIGMFIGLILWAGCIGAVRFAVMHYSGYLVKAGHVAVIAEAMKTGQVPANQISRGKELVSERFLTSNVYFAVDKLVGEAIKQIQKGLQKVSNKLDFTALEDYAEVSYEISQNGDVVASGKLEGITCGFKPTSCPDQLACALEEALAMDK